MEHNAARFFTSHETLFRLTDFGCSMNSGRRNRRVFPSKNRLHRQSERGTAVVVARIKEIHE
jgi:hypothetical protein